MPIALVAQRLPLKMFGMNPSMRKRCSSARLVFCKRPTSISIHNRQGNMFANFGTIGMRRDELQRLKILSAKLAVERTRPSQSSGCRLAALSALVLNWPTFARIAGKGNQGALSDLLFGLQHSFWNFHYTLRSMHRPKKWR